MAEDEFVVRYPSPILTSLGVRPTCAEIDLAAVAHNLKAVQSVVGDGVGVHGVVKADAYGHGAERVARALEAAGAKGLCVALVEEGIALRDAGITLPILVMSGIYRDGVEAAARAKVTPVIYDPGQLAWLASASRTPVRVHLKIDTGMARLGIPLGALDEVARGLAAMEHVTVEGLMTHFANADCDDPSYCVTQLARFDEARRIVFAAGLRPSVIHAANSAAAFRIEESRFDFVRAGIALYGVAPFPYDGPGLLPAMRLRTEVISLRELPPGSPVGYGGVHRTGRRATIATIPIGYADGFFRRLSSEAEVLVRGGRCRVVGNVSMDLCTVDVTEVARVHGVALGDEVVLLGKQSGPAGFAVIRAEEIAQRVGTLPYEVLTAVSRRVPRLYRGA